MSSLDPSPPQRRCFLPAMGLTRLHPAARARCTRARDLWAWHTWRMAYIPPGKNLDFECEAPVHDEPTKNPRGPPFQCCRGVVVSAGAGQVSGQISTLTLGARGLRARDSRLPPPSCRTRRPPPTADSRRIQVFFREGWPQVAGLCAYAGRHGRAGPGWAACYAFANASSSALP